MNSNNFGITELEALNEAVELFAAQGKGDVPAARKLAHMMAMKQVYAEKKSGSNSKAKAETKRQALEVVDAIKASGETVDATWVLEHTTIMPKTVQKVAALMRKAIDLGLIEKTRDAKTGKVLYTAK